MTSAPATSSVSQIDTCQAILRNLGYDFRLNTVTDKIEVFGKKSTILDDKLFKVISAAVSRKFKIHSEQLDIAITEMAWLNQYHPIKTYLNSLSYNGGPHFQDLIQCFDNPDGLYPTWLRKWMIGSVAKIMTGSQNPMLVINGPQGIGKSLFVQWLSSKMPAYFIESRINTEDKDSYDMLTSRWIWEVSEFGSSLKKSDLEALKHFISMAEVTIRPAYGKYSITRPALASMIGTINDRGGGIFDDPTGSRRFLICDVKRINWQEYIKIDINQLWAEIYVAYLSGEPWELTPDERVIQENKNVEYQPKDIIEDCLIDGFEIDPTKMIDPYFFTPTVRIIEYLQTTKNFKAGSTVQLNKMIAQTCKHLGLEQSAQRVPAFVLGQSPKLMRGYKGIRKL